MTWRAVFLTIGVVICVGCTDNAKPLAVSDGTFTQADAVKLSDSCGAPRSWLQVARESEVHFEPPSDAVSDKGQYEKAACVLNGVENAKGTKFGFVGNEKYVTSEAIDGQAR